MIESPTLRGNHAFGQVVPSPAVNPTAVTHFEQLLASTEVPFATAVASAWQCAEARNRHLRVRLTDRLEQGQHHPWSLQELAAIQYDVASITFQQEVATQFAKKATDCVATLIKNG